MRRRKIGILAAAMVLSMTMAMTALAEGESSYVESEQTLEAASQQGLERVNTEPMAYTVMGTQGVGPAGGSSVDPAKAGYTVMGRSIASHTESIGLQNGATITMLKGTETGQQLCLVITDGQGHLVVVDGGQKTNAPYLGRYIQQHGGKVDAWLLTHPHGDHVGALAVLLEKQKAGGMLDFAEFNMGDIYYSFAPQEFYQQKEEAHRLPIIQEIFEDIQNYDQNKVHYNAPAGTIVDIGGIHVEIMNQAYQFDIDSGNNTSIVYRITVGGKTLLATGDLPYEAAEQLLKDRGAEALKADIVQMAHHGQHGGSPAFYQAVAPSIALWPSHSSLWAKVNESFDENQETYTMALTKHWMDSLSVQKNFVMADGDWTLN